MGGAAGVAWISAGTTHLGCEAVVAKHEHASCFVQVQEQSVEGGSESVAYTARKGDSLENTFDRRRNKLMGWVMILKNIST